MVMGMRGPAPKPAEVAEMQGNPGHRPLTRTSDATPTIGLDAPDWLTGAGLDIWSAIVPKLQTLRFVRDTDRHLLARYCDYLARWIALKGKVDQEGEAYETVSNHGQMMRQNPHFRAMLQVEEKLMAAEDRLGLSPSARQQLLRAMANVNGTGDNPLAGRIPGAGQPAPAGPDDLIGIFAAPPTAPGPASGSPKDALN